MDAISLKKYINENKLYQNILEKCNCHSFKSSDKFLRCSIEDKNNNAISLSLDDYLKVKDFSNAGLDGDIFSLYSTMNNLSFGETIKSIHSLLGLKYKYLKDYKNKKNTTSPLDKLKKWRRKSLLNMDFEDLDTYEDNILDEYVPLLYYDWIKYDGIMPRTRDIFDIGFSIKHQRIVIPHYHWSTGEIVGIIGRTVKEYYDLFDIPKYYPIIKYKKSHNLYGLYQNYNEIQKKGYVIVYESEKSVLKRHSRFDGTGVALGGHTVSLHQAKILKELNVEIVIALDKDIDINKVFKACGNFFPCHNVSFIWDKEGLMNDKESPADLKDSDFRKLFNSRIKYTENMNKLKGD